MRKNPTRLLFLLAVLVPTAGCGHDSEVAWTVGETNYRILQFNYAMSFSYSTEDGEGISGYYHKQYDQGIKALKADTWVWHNVPQDGTVRGTHDDSTTPRKIRIEKEFREWQRSGGNRNRFITAVAILHEADHHAGPVGGEGTADKAYNPVKYPDLYHPECAHNWWNHPPPAL